MHRIRKALILLRGKSDDPKATIEEAAALLASYLPGELTQSLACNHYTFKGDRCKACGNIHPHDYVPGLAPRQLLNPKG